jgi:hypothetical protein
MAIRIELFFKLSTPSLEEIGHALDGQERIEDRSGDQPAIEAQDRCQSHKQRLVAAHRAVRITIETPLTILRISMARVDASEHWFRIFHFLITLGRPGGLAMTVGNGETEGLLGAPVKISRGARAFRS